MADLLRKWYRSRLFPIYTAIVILLGHVTGYDIPFAAVLIATVIPGLFVMHELNFLTAPLMMLPFVVTARGFDLATTTYAQYGKMPYLGIIIGGGGALILALVWFMIRHRKTAQKVGFRGLLIGMTILCISMFFNGFFNPRYTAMNLWFVLMIQLSIFIPYLLIAFFGRFEKRDSDDFLYSLMVTGLLILAELIAAYFTTVQFIDGKPVKESVVTGWGVWTTIGGMLTFLMPACFYFAYSHRRGWIGYLLGAAMWVGTVFSQSRGALLMGTIVLGACLLTVCIKGENRKRNRILTAAFAGVGLIGSLILWEKIRVILQNFLDYGFGDNGRFRLWRTGFGHFRKFPLFGSGFYDSYVSEWNVVITPYLYHNTIVQMLAACGIIGLLAYLFHRTQTVVQIVRRPNARKTFLGLCIFGLILSSLIDVLLFKIYPTILYGLILLFLEKCDGKKS